MSERERKKPKDYVHDELFLFFFPLHVKRVSEWGRGRLRDVSVCIQQLSSFQPSLWSLLAIHLLFMYYFVFKEGEDGERDGVLTRQKQHKRS